MSLRKLDRFTLAYIAAALATTNDESSESGGVPLDRNHDVSDLADETLMKMVADCEKFQSDHSEAILTYNVANGHDTLEMAGNDFWLTRNGHGAGFWDGDWPEPEATTLTDAAHAFGEVNLYLGDDGEIYC